MRALRDGRWLVLACASAAGACTAGGPHADEPAGPGAREAHLEEVTALGELEGTALFDGSSLAGWAVTPFGGEGDIELIDGAAVLEMGSMLTGLHYQGNGVGEVDLPRVDYELEVVAARLSGTDFFCGLTFPVRDSFATLVLGGWGGALTGLSCLDGLDASDNETRTHRSYVTGRDYRLRVAVTADRIRAWVDGMSIVDVSIAGREVGLRPEVWPSRPLGFACFATTARLRSVRLRYPLQP